MGQQALIDKELIVPPDGWISPTHWRNPRMKFCPAKNCYFADEDQEVLDRHYLDYHPELVEIVKKDKQVKLDGEELSEADKRILLLENSPNDEVMCPFCFSMQKMRATRTFNQDGSLSKTVTCFDCHAQMRMDSMTKFHDAKAFGYWVGTYKGFWHKVDHDKWMQGLKMVYSMIQRDLFWQGYADGSPKFAERKKQEEIQKQAEEYAAEGE